MRNLVSNKLSGLCPICWEEVPPNKGLEHQSDRGPPHVLHESCIKEWVSRNPSCPMCREPISSIRGAPIGRSESCCNGILVLIGEVIQAWIEHNRNAPLRGSRFRHPLSMIGQLT